MSELHVGIDAGERGIYVARSRLGRRGPRIVGCEVIARDPHISQEEQIAAVALAQPRGAHIELAFDGAALVHGREELPPMRRAATRAVVERRGHALLDKIDGDALFAWIRAANGTGPVWTCAAPEAPARALFERVQELGVAPHRLSSRHLALGQLARALDPHPDGLIAIVELDSESSTCVIADAHGWLFSREVTLRFAADQVPASASHPGATVEQGSLAYEDGPSGLELIGEKDEAGPGDSALDPLEAVGEQADRIATDLSRTFRYASSELGLGDVGSVALVGEAPGIAALAPTLAGALGIPVAPLHEILCGGTLGESATPAGVALGLVLAPDAWNGSLLPPEILEQREVAWYRQRLLIGFAALLCALALAGGALSLRAVSLNHELSDVNGRLAADATLRTQVEQVLAARARSAELGAAIARIERAEPPFTDLLLALGHLTPPGAFIERLHVWRSEDGGWRIDMAVESTGATVAEAARAVSAFRNQVDASPLLAMDATQPEDTGPVAPDASLARLRFRISGRVAAIADPGDVGVSEPADDADALEIGLD